MSKPKILTLAEFLKLKGKQKSPVVVYFNANQWDNLTRDISPGKGTPPEKTLTLTLTEIPGMEGGLANIWMSPRMQWSNSRNGRRATLRLWWSTSYPVRRAGNESRVLLNVRETRRNSCLQGHMPSRYM